MAAFTIIAMFLVQICQGLNTYLKLATFAGLLFLKEWKENICLASWCFQREGTNWFSSQNVFLQHNSQPSNLKYILDLKTIKAYRIKTLFKLLKPSLNWFLFIISCIQSDVAHRCLPPQIQSFLPSIWFLLLLLLLCHHHLQRHLIFPLSCQWHNDKVVRSRKFPDKKGKNFQLWIICQIVDGKRNKT